jgi:rhodanese-related sulfurtransferase
MPHISRRAVVALTVAAFLVPGAVHADDGEIWSAAEAHEALRAGEMILLDIRRPDEWRATGLAEGAWPVSMHEDGFERRLMRVLEIADGRPVGLICATGGRSGYVQNILKENGIRGTVDVSEGMMGSQRGRGWIASGLPQASLEQAERDLPRALRR